MKESIKFKKLLLNVLCVFISISYANAQKIKWGGLNKSTFFTSQFLPKILGEDDANFYTYAKHGTTNVFAIEAYKKNNGDQVYTVEFNAGQSNKRVWLEKAVLMNDKIMIFISEFSNKNNTSEMYVKVYTAKTGKIEKDRVFLFTEDTDENYLNAGRFDAFTSPDNSKILINYFNYNPKKNKFYDNFLLFDEELKKITGRENSYDGEQGDDGSFYTLDNNGNLYYLKNSNTPSIVSYDVENDYEKWEEQIQLKNLNLDFGGIVTELNLKVNQQNDLYIYGIYSKSNNNLYNSAPKGAFDGYIYIKVDNKSKEIVQEKSVLLEQSLIDEIKANMGKYEMYFNLDAIQLNDGGTVLTSEFSIKLPNGSKSRVRYGDVVVSKISKTGVLDWSLRIPKRQQYTASNLQLPWFHKPFFKYTSFTDENNLYILFNDHLKNDFTIQNTPELKTMGNPNSSKISIYSINLNTGKYSTSSLNGNKENGVAMMAPICYQKKQGSSAIVFSKNGRKYTFGVFQK